MAHPNGTPIWFELNTPDKDAAQAFYAAVAGWQIIPSPSPEHADYRVAIAGAVGVAGLMTPPAGMGVPGWSIYFAADDVDAMADRIRSLGGAIHFGPEDIPEVGRFAVVADPQGVTFNIMKGESPDPSTAFAPGPEGIGHGAWIELATPDPDAAFAFYGELFGWTKAGAMPMGPMGEYAFIGVPAGEPMAPGAIMSSTATGAPARWNWYVHVPDIDAAVAAATAGGGTLIQGPDEIPGGSFSANVADPQGSQIGLVGPRSKGAEA